MSSRTAITPPLKAIVLKDMHVGLKPTWWGAQLAYIGLQRKTSRPEGTTRKIKRNPWVPQQSKRNVCDGKIRRYRKRIDALMKNVSLT